jgi:hypothetical protein
MIDDILFAGQYDICRIRIDDLTVTAYSSNRDLLSTTGFRYGEAVHPTGGLMMRWLVRVLGGSMLAGNWTLLQAADRWP